MTLCVIWKCGDQVHFASDSRLSVNAAHTDVAIKVLPVPYRIYSPNDQSGVNSLDFQGELGMCFAGSAVNSLFLKESIAEVLKYLQYAPPYTNKSMDGIAKFIFRAYTIISREICSILYEKGLTAIAIAGLCPEENRFRTYLLETDCRNEHSYKEVLTQSGEHKFIGLEKSKKKAEAALPNNPHNIDYLSALQSIIDDPDEDTVGGAIQYGTFKSGKFETCGIVNYHDGDVHYWRGGLDINSNEFTGSYDTFISSYPFIDPFNTFDK